MLKFNFNTDNWLRNAPSVCCRRRTRNAVCIYVHYIVLISILFCCYCTTNWFFNRRRRRIGRTLNNQYGAGTGNIGLDDVQCAGTETSIYQCPHNAELGPHNAVWGVTNCDHSQDVSIACHEPGK